MSNEIEEKTPFGIVRYEASELEEWDKAIEGAIAAYSKNRIEAERFAIDAVQALYVTDQNLSTVRNQGILKRVLGALTGNNSRLRDEASHNLAKAQHNTLRLLNKLGEQNILLKDSIVAIANYTKYIHTKNIELKEQLLKTFNDIKTRFERNEESIEELTQRIVKLESDQRKLADDVRVIGWAQRAKVEDYERLPKVIRLFKMVRDFKDVKTDYWTSLDLKSFSSALIECGFEKGESITIKDLIRDVINFLGEKEAIEIQERLCLDKVACVEDLVSLPLLYSISETTRIIVETNRYEILRAVIEKAQRQGAKLDEKECLYDIAVNYLNANGIVVDARLGICDLAVDLLQGVKLIEALSKPKTELVEKLQNEDSQGREQKMHKLPPNFQEKPWDKEPEIDLSEGIWLFLRGQLNEATRYFELKSKEYQESATILRYLGLCYSLREIYQEAFNKKKKRGPEYSSRRKYQEAFNSYIKALKLLDPKKEPPYLEVGDKISKEIVAIMIYRFVELGKKEFAEDLDIIASRKFVTWKTQLHPPDSKKVFEALDLILGSSPTSYGDKKPTVDEVFEEVKSRLTTDPSKVAGIKAVFQFVILEGKEWYVDLMGVVPVVKAGHHNSPNCTIETYADTFIGVVTGAVDHQAAFVDEFWVKGSI